MERLKCKACGTESVVPMDVIVENEDEIEDVDELFSTDQDSQFYSCHVCGDNWLSVRETESGGGFKVTFVHQMGMAPTLKRIAYLAGGTDAYDLSDEEWEYFLDDQQVEATSWRQKLSNRRQILRSICSN